MNQQLCEDYREWMSLAQDGLLNQTQTRLLHKHLATCRACQDEWEAMTAVSRLFRRQPTLAPAPGFVARLERRLARRDERRRQLTIGALLGIGVMTLALLALPSVVGALSLTGQLVLPYQTFAAVESLIRWAAFLLMTLADTVWMLVRHAAVRPESWACVGSAAIMGVLVLGSTRVLWTRARPQRAR